MKQIGKHSPVVFTLLALLVLYFLALRTGGSFIMYGLRWPDTCWLLKFGKLILESGQIPKTDPFSFTPDLMRQAGQGQPLVVYQWLSELLFFWSYRCFGIIGLLFIAGAVLLTGSIFIPLRTLKKSQVNPIWSVFAIALVSLSGNLRSVVRPEIFSCIFMAIILSLIHPLRQQVVDLRDRKETSPVDWHRIALIAISMVAWCNLHSAFVSGIIILAIYALFFALDDKQHDRPFSGETKTACAATLIAVLSTLINPYGYHLWAYLPHLFFMPVNGRIEECQPIFSIGLNFAIFFYLLAGLCAGSIVFALRKAKTEGRLEAPALLSAVFTVIVAAILGLMVRRLTSLTSIIMVFETASILSCCLQASPWQGRVWTRKSSFICLEPAMLMFLLFGIVQTSQYYALTIPARTPEFTPPFHAMQIFLNIRSGGRVLGSLPIADMLDLYSKEKPMLFIDSRMDVYSETIIADFISFLHADKDCKNLLSKYQIEWVFMPPGERLCQALKNDPMWVMVYVDSAAVIFHHGRLNLRTTTVPALPGLSGMPKPQAMPAIPAVEPPIKSR